MRVLVLLVDSHSPIFGIMYHFRDIYDGHDVNISGAQFQCFFTLEMWSRYGFSLYSISGDSDVLVSR